MEECVFLVDIFTSSVSCYPDQQTIIFVFIWLILLVVFFGVLRIGCLSPTDAVSQNSY